MTRTIPNVPRELLETLIEQHITAHGCTNHTARQAQLILCAPSPAGVYSADPLACPGCASGCFRCASPAGVDGLEVVGWYRMDGRKDITPFPSVCATWHKMGVKVGAAYSDSAQSTVNGLRYEIDRLIRESSKANPNYHLKLQIECDRSAKRIGELEGLLLESGKTIHKLQAEQPTPARIARYLDAMRSKIDAALSAGKDSAP